MLLVYCQRGLAETPRGGGLRDERDTVKILVTGRGALFARGPLLHALTREVKNHEKGSFAEAVAPAWSRVPNTF